MSLGKRKQEREREKAKAATRDRRQAFTLLFCSFSIIVMISIIMAQFQAGKPREGNQIMCEEGR